MSDSKNLWSETKRLLIVFPYKDEVNFKNYRISLDKLLNDSNVEELKIIVEIPNSVKKEDLQQHKMISYLSAKDISFFGKIKDEKIRSILNQSFDTLLWFEAENKKSIKFFSKTNITWKIGVKTDFNFFTIRIDCQSENPEEIVSFAKNTLQKISSEN